MTIYRITVRLLVLLYGITLVLTLSQCHPSFFADEWDHFVYAQQWPQSLCLDNAGDVNTTTNCTIPKEVTTWVVHGLWPTKNATQGPQCCGCSQSSSGCHNCTTPFDPSLTKDLEPQLNVFWPNLLSKEHATPYDFWKHEWEKHGTCGTSLEVIDSQHKYFVMGLKLNQQFNILQALLTHGIKPSLEIQYTYNSVLNAFVDSFGYKPILECYYNSTTKTSYLESVQFCITKEFEIMACPPSNTKMHYYRAPTCWTDEKITIPPLVYSNPVKVEDIRVKLLDELNV